MIQKEIKIFGKTVQLTMRNDGDYAIANELFLDHQYRLCDEVIKKTTNPIIDIGGHLGFFSLYAALLNANVPIYAFEPHEGNFELLKINLKNNRIKNVTPKQLAVSDKQEQVRLLISQEDLNHSITKALEPTGETQPVQATTLERIFQKNRIERCDLIKMDCEGAEYNILYTTPKTIFDKVSNIFLEYHDWATGEEEIAHHRSSAGEDPHPRRNHQALKTYLENMGFKVAHFPNYKMKELGFLWCTRQ